MTTIILFLAFIIYPIVKFIRWIAIRNGWQEPPETTNLFTELDKVVKGLAIFCLLVLLIGLGVCFVLIKG